MPGFTWLLRSPLLSSVTSTPTASNYWGINATATYGNKKTTIMPLASGILDTGTTLVLLASDFFDEYKSVTGAVLDEKTGFLKLTKTQFAQLETFYIVAGDVSHLEFKLHLSMTTPS